MSHSSATCVHLDPYGQLWIGTRSGLNKYDGGRMRVYKEGPAEFGHLSDDYIGAIHQISSDELLIGTRTSLFTYNYDSDDFEEISISGLESIWVTEITQSDDETIWVSSFQALVKMTALDTTVFQVDSKNKASLSNDECLGVEVSGDSVFIASVTGLNIYNGLSGEFTNAENSDHKLFELANESYAVLRTAKNELWTGTYSENKDQLGLLKYNLSTDEYQVYHAGESGLELVKTLYEAVESKDGRIHFGMNGGGYAIYDPKTDEFQQFLFDPKEEKGISDLDVTRIRIDKNGTIWITTDGSGLNYYNPLFDRFRTFKNNPFDKQSVGVDDTHAFYEGENYLWVGNNALGLSRMERSSGKFHNYPFTEDSNRSLLDNTVYAVTEDKYGAVWVGSYSGGLSRLDVGSNMFTHIFNELDKPNVIPSNYNSSLLADGDNLWVGSAQGLGHIDLKTMKPSILLRLPYADNGFGDVVYDLHLQNESTLLVGSHLGLYAYNIPSGEYRSIHKELETWINTIEIIEEVIWAGTQSGLAKHENGSVDWYTTEHGLADNDVLGVVSDKQGRIWISSSGGLDLLDPGSGVITNFNDSDGLQSNQFNPGSIHKGKSGIIYVGGLKGFNLFDPEMISNRERTPDVHFSDLIITKGSEQKRINLLNQSTFEVEHDDDILNLAFFSDEIIDPGKTSFEYRIREIDESTWITTKSYELNFTDLSSGNYTLDVRASNYDGIFGEYATMEFLVRPPFWRTPLAYIVYSIIIIAIFFGRDRYLKAERVRLENVVQDRTSEIRLQKEKAEEDKVLISQQAKDLESLNQVKSRFFSNVSHEFRTPLTLIKGPIEAVISGMLKDQKDQMENLHVARRNSLVLQNLIDELLEFNRLETGDIQIHKIPVFFKELVSKLLGNYEILVKEKNLKLSTAFEFPDDLKIELDSKKFEHVLNNLISNAVKHTPEKGKISLKLTYRNGQVAGSVLDTGEGIDEEELPHIFERFYQSSHGTQTASSSGIGLAYVKEILILLGGTIQVKSKVGEGTRFEFIIPAERIEFDGDSSDGEEKDHFEVPERYAHPNNKILIVEDNLDLQNYIQQILEPEFELKCAHNGREALSILENFKADLVVSDIMMPLMDGMELLETLKADEKLKYLSVIMLTAKSSEETKIEALRFGLDDYMTKPFNPVELEIRVKNILGNQYERIQAFQENNEDESELDVDPLVKDLTEIIESNLSNSSFGVLNLSHEVALSDRQLTRVVKKATGLTPASLIREVKLQHGKKHLETRIFRTVSEVSYAIGFEKPSHFSKLYFERFGKKPSDYFK